MKSDAATALATEIAAAEKELRALPFVVDVALIGSAMYLPNPADIDFALLIDEFNGQGAVDYANALLKTGWIACSEYDGVGGTWCAVRRDRLNLMVTHDRTFFDGYKLAMEVCKVLRLEEKQDRIDVCSVVRDGKKADDIKPWPAYVDIDMRHAEDPFVDTEHERLAKLVLELAEACDNAAADIGGSRPQLDILREATALAERFKERANG
jgi:hypothetical protein